MPLPGLTYLRRCEVSEQKGSKRSQKPNRYTLNHRRILLRAHIPRMLGLVSDLHGSDAELLVTQMLLHGRVRLSMLSKYMQTDDQM